MESTQLNHQYLKAGRYDILQGEAFSHQQVNKAAVESGQAMGFNLQVENNPMADLMDSMEELSFQFEEKEMKRMGDRSVGEKRTRSPFFIAVQGWQKVMPDMPGGEFMERMLRMLRQGKARNLNPQWLLKELSEGSSDPSHQFAMLECLEEALKENPEDQELSQLVKETKAQLQEAKGPEIKAGLNLAEQINSMAKSPDEMQDLRQLYRGEILGFETPQHCFKSLLAQRGAGRLTESIDFLIKGCSIELQSPSPSQSPEELHRILNDLQCVNVLHAVLDTNNAMVAKMKSQFNEACLLNGERMTERIMDMTEMPFVNAGNISSYVDACGIKGLLAQVYFCTSLVDTFHHLSPRLFNDNTDRFKLIDAGQEHLDSLVAKQEDEDETASRRMGEEL